MSCDYCGESRFGSSGQRSCHISKNHAEFACTCFRRYTSTEELQKHQKEMADNAKDCKCSSCCRSFSKQDDLHQHQRSKSHWQEGERQKAQKDCGRVFCHDSCGRSFTTEKGLVDHIGFRKGDEDRNKCYDCLRPFVDAANLSQHQKDTNHNNKNGSERRNQYVNAFYDTRVKVDRTEKKEAVRLVTDLRQQIITHVRGQPGGEIFSPDIRNAGSHPAKTKIGKPNEFDTNVPLNVKGAEELTNGKVSFRYVTPPNNGNGVPPPNNMNVPRVITDVPKGSGKNIRIGDAIIKTTDAKVPAHLTRNGQLVPHEVKRDLHGKIKTAINELGLKDKVHLSSLAHGPAITLNIKAKYDINVDVVPTYPSSVPVGRHGWPRPDTRRAFTADQIKEVQEAGLHLVPKNDTTWYTSVSKAETAMFKTLDRGNGCRKDVLKYMKKVVGDATSRSPDGLPGVSSHLMKNQILWTSERHPQPDHWQKRNFAERLVDTMGEFESALRSCKLPNYFNTSENVLAGKDRDVLNRLADQMRDERGKLVHM